MISIVFFILSLIHASIGSPALPLCNYKPGEPCGCFMVQKYGYSDEPGVCFDGFTKTQNRVWTDQGLCRTSGGIGDVCTGGISGAGYSLDMVAYCTTPSLGADTTKQPGAAGCCNRQNCAKCGRATAGRCTLCADGFVGINKEVLQVATVYDCVSPESITTTTTTTTKTLNEVGSGVGSSGIATREQRVSSSPIVEQQETKTKTRRDGDDDDRDDGVSSDSSDSSSSSSSSNSSSSSLLVALIALVSVLVVLCLIGLLLLLRLTMNKRLAPTTAAAASPTLVDAESQRKAVSNTYDSLYIGAEPLALGHDNVARRGPDNMYTAPPPPPPQHRQIEQYAQPNETFVL